MHFFATSEEHWECLELRKISSAKIHVHPGGRLGNQLYFAAAAENLRHHLSERGSHVELVWHSNEDYYKDIQKITGFKIDQIRRYKFIRLLIFEKKNLSERNLFVRGIYSIWIRSKKFGRHVVSDSELTDLKEIPIKKSYFLDRYSQFAKTAEVAVDIWRDNIENYRSDILKEVSIPKGVIGISMRFGDFLNPDVAREQGNLDFSYFSESLLKISGSENLSSPIWLFSDDPNAGLTELKSHGYTNVFDIRTLGFDVPGELVLLSSMKNLILCNSTFSWWGGYFQCENANIIAPKPLTRNCLSEPARATHWKGIDAHF